MAAYATPEDYKTYGSGAVNEEVIDKALINASDDIDSLTFGRIHRTGFDDLYPSQQELIKKAVCLQADYVATYGSFFNSPVQSYSIGKTSMTFNGEIVSGVHTEDKVIALLDRTGLTCLVL